MRVIDAWAAKAAADPSVISLPAVRVARIARELRGLPEDAARVPHIFGLALPRRLAEAHKSDWGLPDSLPDSDWYLLLPHPDDSDPRAVRRRRAAWLHLQFDKVWDNERPGGPIRQAAEDLWRKLEPIARIEIVEVLVAENRLDPDPDAEEAQREWLATTLEVAAIDPRLAAGWFPQACRYADDIDRVLAMCRPFTLAPELPWPRVADEPPHANVHLDPETLPETTPRPPRPEHRDDLSDMVAGSEEAYERLAGRIARSWGEGVRPEGEWLRLLKGAKVDLKAHDLNKAFRFYYDLQAAADELERVSYANDVVETVLSRNRLKLGRPLELPDDVRVMRRLRSAHKHLEALALPAEIANPWAAALEAATHAAGERVRELIRPRLIEAFAEVGLTPGNRVEEVALGKVVEELIDAVQANGFLRMSDVRDAIARNEIKLPDLSIGSFFRGDALLRLNAILPLKLDGIYRRGEVYLRGLQRMTSLFFGTWLGRFLTLYFLLPVIGSFVILEGAHHMVALPGQFYHFVTAKPSTPVPVPPANEEISSDEEDGAAAVEAALLRDKAELDAKIAKAKEVSFLTRWETITAGAIFLGLLLHWPAFRRRVGEFSTFVFWRVPKAILTSKWLRMAWSNPISRFVRFRLGVPFLIGLTIFGLAVYVGKQPPDSYLFGLGGMLTALLFMQTPLGRDLQDEVNDLIDRMWYRVSVNFVMGIVTFFIDLFRWIMDRIERLFYAVDQWLRFRQGESLFSRWAKRLIGVVWFAVTYVFRFGINILLEPQVNPIKHFPVVTVSHKLLLPLIPSLAEAFSTSIGAMTFIVGCIPGVFGFLAWELMSNWRMYRANRAKNIKHEPLGSHNESLRGLLRLGFHSGAVPRSYARLRKLAAEPREAIFRRRMRLYAHQIDHHGEGLERFAARWFVQFASGAKGWDGPPLKVHGVWAATNLLELSFDRGGTRCLTARLSFHREWLCADADAGPAWSELSERQRRIMHDALAGLYAAGGVRLVWDQWVKKLGIDERGLRPLDRATVGEELSGRAWKLGLTGWTEIDRASAEEIPEESLDFKRVEIEQRLWIARWEAERHDEVPPILPSDAWKLVPG